MAIVLVAGVVPPSPKAAGSYDDLLALFEEWRELESPPLLDGASVWPRGPQSR